MARRGGCRRAPAALPRCRPWPSRQAAAEIKQPKAHKEAIFFYKKAKRIEVAVANPEMPTDEVVALLQARAAVRRCTALGSGRAGRRGRVRHPLRRGVWIGGHEARARPPRGWSGAAQTQFEKLSPQEAAPYEEEATKDLRRYQEACDAHKAKKDELLQVSRTLKTKIKAIEKELKAGPRWQ